MQLLPRGRGVCPPVPTEGSGRLRRVQARPEPPCSRLPCFKYTLLLVCLLLVQSPVTTLVSRCPTARGGRPRAGAPSPPRLCLSASGGLHPQTPTRFIFRSESDWFSCVGVKSFVHCLLSIQECFFPLSFMPIQNRFKHPQNKPVLI